MSTDLVRHALNGPVMGTRWSAVVYTAVGFDVAQLHAALTQAVVLVDRQMSTWKPDSDLVRLNASPIDQWLPLPPSLLEVIDIGLTVGRASAGAFDIGMGDLVNAWGFGPQAADPLKLRGLINQTRPRADEVLDLDRPAGRLRKRAAITLDLGGIAKGYGVDQMMAVIQRHDIAAALVSLDGELRAKGSQPGGSPWTIAVERPDYAQRAPEAVLALQDAAVATSGDYRHWIEIGARRFSHTMDRRLGGPINHGPASVTIVAPTCVLADAWATAMMVLGSTKGADLARRLGLHALFLNRDGTVLRQTTVGDLFEPAAD